MFKKVSEDEKEIWYRFFQSLGFVCTAASIISGIAKKPVISRVISIIHATSNLLAWEMRPQRVIHEQDQVRSLNKVRSQFIMDKVKRDFKEKQNKGR